MTDKAAQRPAQNPAKTPHNGCTKAEIKPAESRASDCTKPHKTETPVSNDTEGAAHEAAAPSVDNDIRKPPANPDSPYFVLDDDGGWMGEGPAKSAARRKGRKEKGEQ